MFGSGSCVTHCVNSPVIEVPVISSSSHVSFALTRFQALLCSLHTLSSCTVAELPLPVTMMGHQSSDCVVNIAQELVAAELSNEFLS